MIAGSETPGGGAVPGGAQQVGQVEKIQVTATLSDLAEVFEVVKDVNGRWVPEGGGDLKSELQAGLLQMGFAPSFLDNVDLAGIHAMWAAYPAQDSSATAKDANIAATIAVVDGRKLIEATPASSRPQPLGDGMWQLKSGDGQLLLEESGKELLLGMSPEDISRAAGLRAQASADHRLTAKVWNIPKDDLDPAALFGLPANSKLAKDLSAVFKELASIELVADVGMAKDGTMTLSAEAPFSKLGIDPIGKPRATATALESKLPGDPMLVTTLSWGDPALIEKLINDQIPVAQIPEPFAGIVRQVITASTTLLAEVANDVVFGLYVDAKGRMTAVVAADVRDDAKTQAAMRSIADALRQAIDAQQALAGKNTAAHIGFEWKADGVTAGTAKADRMVLRAPKEMVGELEEVEFLLDKGAVEIVSFVKDRTAFVAIGPGAKPMATDMLKGIGKPRKTSLAQHEGLGTLRTTMGGCQICVAMDPVSYLRFRVAVMAAKDKSAAKQAKASMADLKKVGDVGEPGLGIKVEANRGALGVSLPQEMMFADKASIEAILRVQEVVDGSGFASADAPPVRELAAEPEPASKKKKPAAPKKSG